VNADVGQAIAGPTSVAIPWRRWLAVAGVLLGWQLAFWPLVHLAERNARPPAMDTRSAIEYVPLGADRAPLPDVAARQAVRRSAPVAYYVSRGLDAPYVRFVVPFDVEDPRRPLALFLGVRNSVDEIRLNGALIQALAPLPKLNGLVTSEPLYLPLPADRLVTGRNVLTLDTPNFGTQWLAEFAVGDAAALARAWRWKNLLQTDLALVGLAVLVFTILLCVVVRWPPPDRPRIHALVLLLATCAASTYLLTFGAPVPLSVLGTVFLYTLSNAFIALAILGYVLLDVGSGTARRRVPAAAWVIAPLPCAAAIAGARAIGPEGVWLMAAVQASFCVVVATAALALPMLALQLVRERGARWFERSMLAFCIAAFAVDRLGSVVPLYSPFDLDLPLTLGWSQIVGALLGLSIVVALAREATEARRTVADANDRLQARLAERESELRTVHRREQETQRRAVLLEERQRIVRDMHDGIGGQLLGLSLQARAPGADPRQLAEGLDASLLDLRLIIDSMDSAEAGLAESVFAFAHRVRPQVEAAGLTLALDNRLVPGAPVIGSRFTLQLMRVLQEAVANALRHSGASTLRIEAAGGEGGVQIQVCDDGRGMPSEARPGRGLENMRARMSALGGACEILDTGRGVWVRFTLPAQALAASVP
jgi:two-component system sensor histidine kinase UhpB